MNAFTALKTVSISGAGTSYIALDRGAERHIVCASDMTHVTSISTTCSETVGVSSVWQILDLDGETDDNDVAQFDLVGGVSGIRVIHTDALTVDIATRL